MSGKYYLNNTGQEIQEVIDDVRNKAVYEDATQIQHGLMAADDKRKLDELHNDEPLTILEIEQLLNF